MMNRNAKKELMFLLGVGAFAALKLKQNKVAVALGLCAGTIAITNFNSKNNFKGKIVAITGGSRGLGLALAKNLLAQGAVIHLMARDEAELLAAEKILILTGPKENIHLVTCDITNKEDLSNAIIQIYRTAARIDVWINNAGSILVGPFDSMTIEDFKAQMNLHLFANIQATQEILPIFRRQKQGQIINICSLGGKIALPHMLPYDTSKFALAGFSQGLSAELAQENITVTTVYPATLQTGSPIQAVFKGDCAKEFSWFANADVLPGLSTDADTAAKEILAAASERRAELVISSLGRLRLLAGILFPELMSTTMGWMNQVLPNKNSMTYQTGAQVKSSKSYLFSQLEQTENKAEALWNQKAKTDAKFNLGVD